MARKKKSTSKPPGETNTSFMFPELHEAVADAVAERLPSVWFCKSHNNGNANNKYPTHVMGSFRCTNQTCSTTGWGSKKVAILIRGYTGNGYNAVVFNQRCQECNNLGSFNLDEQSYVDRIAYRVQKWAGLDVETPVYNSKDGPPHKTELCEGCKKGLCREGDWR